MMKVILEKQAAENNKIIFFSSFRYTLRYLYKRIETAGLRVAQIDGSVKDSERQSLRGRFELDRNEKAALDILLFSEVGSGGLNYQFCDMIINYDLPWNLMRIEQMKMRQVTRETVTIETSNTILTREKVHMRKPCYHGDNALLYQSVYCPVAVAALIWLGYGCLKRL